MSNAVSTAEAGEQLAAIVHRVIREDAPVIVETDGQPRAVVVSYAEYARIRALAEQARHEAAETLQRLRAKVSAGNPDLTDEERTELAERAVRDAIAGLVAKGAVRFEE